MARSLSAFDKGISSFRERGGGGVADLAQIIGVSRQALNHWRTRGVPPNYCNAFSAATGISVKLLRPGDWHEFWPHLAEAGAEA